MVEKVILSLFGWLRMPEHFVSRNVGFIPAHLQDRGVKGVEKLSDRCLVALSQVAYERARTRLGLRPRVSHFVREMNVIAVAVEAALLGLRVSDERVRIVLGWYGVLSPEEPNQTSDRTRLARPEISESATQA